MPRPPQRRTTRPPPPLVTHSKPSVPAVTHSKPSDATISSHPPPGFGDLIKQGIGFGIGQSIAHRAVSAIIGPATTTVVQKSTESKPICVFEKNTFDKCLQTKIQEDQCNNEHLAYTQCLELNQKFQ